MAAAVDPPPNVDAYVASFPADVRPVLESLRATVLAAAPGSTEGIRYGMPVVSLAQGYVVHWAGWKHHMAMYPVPSMPAAIEQQVAPLRSGKDTVKFPLRDPLPVELVRSITEVLVERRLAAEA